MELNGKVALLTGVSSWIDDAMTRGVAGRGGDGLALTARGARNHVWAVIPLILTRRRQTYAGHLLFRSAE